MKAVITGAGSFIGRRLSILLEKEGCELFCLNHSIEEESEKLPENADIWIHFAWGGKGSAGRNDRAVQEENVRMSLNALRKAVSLKCSRFFFAGSQAEYGGVHTAFEDSLSHEEDSCFPVSEYGRAKLEMLDRARELEKNGELGGLRYIHLRLFSVYGPGDHPSSLISTILDRGEDGEMLRLGPCAQRWDYMHVDDAARALAFLAGHRGELPQIINIASGDIRPLREFAMRTAELAGVSDRLMFGARSDNAEGSADLAPSCDKLKGLGFVPAIGFDDGITGMLPARQYTDR